jgi:hypothetical protein
LFNSGCPNIAFEPNGRVLAANEVFRRVSASYFRLPRLPLYTQVVIFKLDTAVARQDFLAVSAKMFRWLKQCPGFINYTLYEGDEVWCDTVSWEGRSYAEQGMLAFYQSDVSKEIVNLVEPGFTSFFGTPLALPSHDT